MNRRTLLTVCVGLLLPLPLALLLGTLLQPEHGQAALTGMIVSPMLDGEQRARLATYRRRCFSTAECEPPLGCLYEDRYRQAYCTDSQCATDTQCPEGQVCRALASQGSDLFVRACIPVGLRQEGEHCYRLPANQKSACVEELMCGGRYGWCARPCRLGKQNECSEGFFCADTRPQPACLPTCEKEGCPAGQHCIRFEEGASMCARVYGTHCQQTPCSGGQRCKVFANPPQPGKVWMNCVERCGKDLPPCSAGRVCDGYECVPACDPQGPSVCAEGYRCRQPWPDDPFGCHPDW
jgi:Cys-rich repeat protein